MNDRRRQTENYKFSLLMMFQSQCCFCSMLTQLQTFPTKFSLKLTEKIFSKFLQQSSVCYFSFRELHATFSLLNRGWNSLGMVDMSPGQGIYYRHYILLSYLSQKLFSQIRILFFEILINY